MRTSSQLNRAESPAVYHPINMLDDDPATMWCEGAEGYGEGEEIRIFFKRPQKIDKLPVVRTASGGAKDAQHG